jgi:hypothetical protein
MTHHGVDLNQIGLKPNAQHQREGNWASILEKSESFSAAGCGAPDAQEP